MEKFTSIAKHTSTALTVVFGAISAYFAAWPRTPQPISVTQGEVTQMTWLWPTLFITFMVLAALLHVWAAYVGREKKGIGASMETQRVNVMQWEDRPLIRVADRQFFNERIPLDGHEYTDCIFTNPTFVYNGEARFALDTNTIRGSMRFDTDSDAVAGAWTIAKAFGVGGMQLTDKDFKPLKHVESVKVINTSAKKAEQSDKKAE